jgi:replication initiation protein RepC
MGPENAAAMMACILERAGYINSAGGYLRDLTTKRGAGSFAQASADGAVAER